MTLEGFLALISGPIGALALLTMGFGIFARMVLSGALVPGRYYDAVVKDNEFLRDKLNAALENNDRTLDRVVPSPVRARREP